MQRRRAMTVASVAMAATLTGAMAFGEVSGAFATQNALRLTADALQKLMRHKSYQTTQRYINMASQLDEAVDKLHVPDVLKVKAAN